LKIRWFYSLLSAALVLAGCALLREEVTVVPDERAGANLVVYFAKDRDTRRMVRAIARKTGGELFDVSGENPLFDPLAYDTFFVGGSLEEGHIAAALEDFLAQIDFIDGRVVPFWTSREGMDSSSADLNEEFERLMQGERFLSGGGFTFAKRVKAEEIEGIAEIWAESVLTELGVRQAAGGDQAEDTVKLFVTAYDGRLGSVVFQDGDWTLEMDGVRWHYAQGRFLPQEDADRVEDFRPHFLYRYFLEPPADPDETSRWRETANRIISRRTSLDSYRVNRPSVSPEAVRSPFFETIWQAHDRAEAFSHQQWIDFLGRRVQIHQYIVAPLGRVDERIQELAKNDPEIPSWLNNLASITGWNWRNIAGSENRSFHAYGAAVDLLMKSQAGMETYWQWTAAKGLDWRTVPTEKRQTPPVAVIRAFEEQGFIWGGRWARYDTMHFEYHPELLIMGTGRG
jgi:flavodoxin